MPQLEGAVTLEQFVIYESPRDYPERFVVRRWRIYMGRAVADMRPFAIVGTLAEARAAVPARADACFARDETDEAVIVETWM